MFPGWRHKQLFLKILKIIVQVQRRHIFFFNFCAIILINWLGLPERFKLHFLNIHSNMISTDLLIEALVCLLVWAFLFFIVILKMDEFKFTFLNFLKNDCWKVWILSFLFFWNDLLLVYIGKSRDISCKLIGFCLIQCRWSALFRQIFALESNIVNCHLTILTEIPAFICSILNMFIHITSKNIFFRFFTFFLAMLISYR